MYTVDMRPKDLHFKHTLLQEKVPFFQQNILFAPNILKEQTDLLQDYWSWILSRKKISIEFCSGNGEWIVQKAKDDPEGTWIAVEKNFSRVRKIWSKTKNHDLQNLLIVYGCGQVFAKSYLPIEKVATVYINFPDPWPKKRHKKHRIMNIEFLQSLERLLITSGTMFFITDSFSYLETVVKLFTQSPSKWKALLPDPFYSTSYYPEYGTSWFGELWKNKGKDIFCTSFQKESAEKQKIGVEGFEPPTHCSQSSCASQAAPYSDPLQSL